MGRQAAEVMDASFREQGMPRDPLLDFPADFHIPPDVASQLSSRTKYVLVLVAFGRSVEQIAATLRLSPVTIISLRTQVGHVIGGRVTQSRARRVIGLPDLKRRPKRRFAA